MVSFDPAHQAATLPGETPLSRCLCPRTPKRKRSEMSTTLATNLQALTQTDVAVELVHSSGATSHRALELHLSGTQVTVGLAAGFFLAGPLLWAVVSFWLFAP
jgi:hypothetical protein